MRHLARHALLIAYLPLSCGLAGWMAWASGCEVPGTRETAFLPVFLSFAFPVPGNAGLMRAPSLAIGLSSLVLLALLRGDDVGRLRARCIRTLLALVAILVLLPYKILWEILYPAMGTDMGWRVSMVLTQLFVYAQMLIDPLLAWGIALLPVWATETRLEQAARAPAPLRLAWR